MPPNPLFQLRRKYVIHQKLFIYVFVSVFIFCFDLWITVLWWGNWFYMSSHLWLSLPF